jgi:hypothetical protein
MAEPLTEDEKQTLKAAAFGAVYLVSNADPGFFNVLRESFAASGALAGATGVVKEVLTSGTLPRLPKSSTADSADIDASQSDTAAFVLSALRRSVAILAGKAPEELENYRSTVINAVDRVAGAANGVSEKESAMISTVKEALAG